VRHQNPCEGEQVIDNASLSLLMVVWDLILVGAVLLLISIFLWLWMKGD
jgi:hypothetical protein